MLAVRAPTREEEQIKAEPNTQRGASRLTSACSQAGGSSPAWKIKGFFIRDKCLALIFMLARVRKKKKTLPLHSSRDGTISIFSRQLLHHVAFVFDGLPAGRFILSYSVSVVILYFK